MYFPHQKPTTIYLVRHGETEWNLQKRVQGHTDIPLNSHGKEQAKALHAILTKEKIDAVFSSDLSRAYQTAEILSSHLPLTINQAKELRERAFGPFEGLTVDQYRAKYFLEVGDENHPFEGPFETKWHPEVESTSEVLERTLSFISNQVKLHPEKTLLMVTHGGVLHGVMNHVRGAPLNISIQNCAYLHLTWDLEEDKLRLEKIVN